MQLFYAPPSPYARKTRIVARELGLIDGIEEIVVNPFTDDPRLLAANPAGLVPTLVTDNGASVIDSPLICRHLSEAAAVIDGLAHDDASRWKSFRAEALADALMDCAVAVMEERRHADAAPSAAFINRKIEKIARCLSQMPVQTDRTQDTPDLGQIAIACALSYLSFRFPDFDWPARRPDLAVWHSDIEQRAAFQSTQLKDHRLEPA